MESLYKGWKILLGSGSPRRSELLTMMDIPFKKVAVKDVDETYPLSLPPDMVPQYLSKIKSDAYRSILQNGQILITADTVVILDDKILGKPIDRKDALTMLKNLSGNTHRVVTGVTLASVSDCVSFSETTYVHFLDLSSDEIEYYVDRYHPFDKAGSYGIQEWIGSVAISRIDGCFYNVMGLPTSTLHRRLLEFAALRQK